MNARTLMTRFAAADEKRKTDALERLKSAAVDLASREDAIDPVELAQLDALLYSAGRSRSQFAADVGRWHNIAELRRQLASVDESALLKELADAGKDFDRILEAGSAVEPFNGSHKDQQRWNVESAAQVRRQNEGRARIEQAQARVANLRQRRAKLAELEGEAGGGTGHLKVSRATLGFALAAGRV